MTGLRRTSRRAGLALVVACLLLALPATVAAHAALVSSSPSDGEELAASPAEIRLVFSESPDPESVSVRLFDRYGGEIELGIPETDAAFPTTVSVPISRELRPGPYTVVWSVVSEEDEHPASREFVFGVEEPADGPSVTAAELAGDEGGSAAVLARYLTLVGLMMVVGAAVQARWFGLVPLRMAYVAAVGAVGVFAGLIVAALVTAGARVASTGPPAWLDPSLVAGIGLASLAFFAALAAAGTDARRARWLWLLVVLAGAGLAWILAAQSHAAGVGILLWVGFVWDAIDLAIEQPALYAMFPHLFELARQLNVLVAALHSLAVAAWIGGLLAAGVAGMSSEKTAEWHPRFSRFAMGAFLVVAATGLYQAVLYLASPDSVVNTDYGVMLLGKHVFVVGVLGLAAVNRFLIVPALRRGTGRLRARAVAVVRTEAALGVLVVGAAVLLATTPPARPPTDVFLAPEVIAELAERRQTIAGDRQGWQLVIARQSSNSHEFRVRGSDSRSSDGTLLLEGPGGNPERRLTLERDGAEMTAEGLVLTRDGRWTASVTLSPNEAQFSFEVRAGHVVPYDAAARSLWDEAIAETERRMQSARMIDVLTDGLSLMLFVHHDLVAPDRERLEILGGSEMVSIGQQRFRREPGGEWDVQELGFAFEWPDYGFLERAIGVTFAGSSSHGGREVTVLDGYDPETRVGYEIWVGRHDLLIYRLVMGVPGHYMINAYYDINASVSVEPPVSR